MDYQLRLKVFWSGEERDQVLSSLSDLLRHNGSVSLFEDISDAFFSESVDLEGLEVQWVKGLFWASDSHGEKNKELPATLKALLKRPISRRRKIPLNPPRFPEF